MDLRFSDEDERFREQVRAWLEENLAGEYAPLRGRGGPGDEHALIEGRRLWERCLGTAGYIALGWPREHGGRAAPLIQQVIFNEEYARARAPGRLGHIGAELLAPTLLAFGTAEQERRFLPAIAHGEEFWCQGYSEPNAGSDLANVQTTAELRGGEWIITGQKTWTSLAHVADWCFVLCRSDRAAPRHRGLSYLLVPMRQSAVTIRPIVQMTGSSEFNEVFFDGARTPGENVVGEVGGGWKVAMATLAFERGVSTLGQQIGFGNELAQLIAAAQKNGAVYDVALRHRLVDAWIGLRVMRLNALRTLAHGTELPRAAMITKLFWSRWHRALGELGMQLLGADAEILDGPDYQLSALQRLFLFSRADTIYAGSDEIQRNLIGERALGLPPEPRP